LFTVFSKIKRLVQLIHGEMELRP